MLNLDTHILICALLDEVTRAERKKLSEHEWSISAIVLWEIHKLHQLKRIKFDLRDAALQRLLRQLRIWPVDHDVCFQLHRIDFKSDTADEIIAATSLAHQVPLLTRDKTIRKSKIVPLA